jgi:acetyl esterase/lipase
MFRHLCLLLAFALSAHAQEIKADVDVEYGNANGKPLQLDVYQPAAKSEKPRPALLLIHGGGWILGSRKDFRGEAELAAKGGYVAFSVGYRLVFGSDTQWPAQLDDVQRAVRWVRANATRFNIDPERLGAVGVSAGGHLVAFLGTTDTRDNSDSALAAYSSRVKCVVDLFGPTDLNHDFSKVIPLGNQANELVKKLLGATPAEKPELAREASPLNRVDAKSAPFLIFHGQRDRLVPVTQSEVLHAALKKAGVESKLILFPDEDHGLNKPANQQTFRKETVEFLKRHLQP